MRLKIIQVRGLFITSNTKSCGCPSIIDEDWELKETEWTETAFYKTRISMFFHVPIGLNKKLKKAREKMAEKGYSESIPHTVMLKDGLFSGLVLIGVEPATTREPDIEVVTSGPIVTKVFKSGGKSLNKTVAELLSYIRSKTDAHPEAVYFWLVTCDECMDGDQEKIVIIAKL